uniref:Uncharacterized protein n=1 Tax=Branchiostoma floridae TaxID=7739 RepID=C3YEL5_BRAFL|eukprot:XP_002605307.1 hypothetical protein BRAFLDRAFT_89051 [Branchiostoma floridae]
MLKVLWALESLFAVLGLLLFARLVIIATQLLNRPTSVLPRGWIAWLLGQVTDLLYVIGVTVCGCVIIVSLVITSTEYISYGWHYAQFGGFCGKTCSVKELSHALLGESGCPGWFGDRYNEVFLNIYLGDHVSFLEMSRWYSRDRWAAYCGKTCSVPELRDICDDVWGCEIFWSPCDRVYRDIYLGDSPHPLQPIQMSESVLPPGVPARRPVSYCKTCSVLQLVYLLREASPDKSTSALLWPRLEKYTEVFPNILLGDRTKTGDTTCGS